MVSKKLSGLMAASLILIFLVSACTSKKEAIPAPVQQPAAEPPKEEVKQEAKEVVQKESVVPEEIKAVGEQISSADETSSDLNTEELADVEGALAEIENI